MVSHAGRTVVAGVDSSTQSCTVELRDARTGELLGSGRAPHPATFPPVSEQDPAVWWAALRTALGMACRNAAVEASAIGAISVAAQCHGLVVLDASGAPIRPVKLWNDTTSATQCARLIDRFGAHNWVKTIGLTPSPALTVSKLAWLAEHEPGQLRRVSSVMVPHDWLTFRLTGHRVTDRSDASGTGYYAATENRWCIDLLQRFVSEDVSWQDALPTVLGPNDRAGEVRPEAAADLGLAPGTVVGAGGGDQHLGAVGLGIRPGDVAYSLGTSGVVLTTSPEPVFDLTGWIDGVADATGGYLPLVCTLNSTKVTDTFARLLDVGVEELGHLALAADPAQARPVLVGYLDGERSPARPYARGLLGGITTSIDRESLALSVFEGVIAGIVRGHLAIDAAGIRTAGDVVVAGGGARSLAYRQLLADILGRPVHTRDASEATARGACVQAAAVLGDAPITEVRDAWAPPTTTETGPRPGSTPGLRPEYLRLAAFEELDRPWQ